MILVHVVGTRFTAFYTTSLRLRISRRSPAYQLKERTKSIGDLLLITTLMKRPR